MTQVIAVGDNCLDLFLTRGQMAFGGNALNVAVQWHRMGLQARYFGAVGEDATGALMRQAVLKAGLADEMEILPGTTAVTLLEEVAGDRRFILEDLGCGLHYIPDAPRMQALAGASWVHLGTNTAPALVRDLVGQGTRFSLDLSTRHQEQDLTGVPLVLASGQGAPRAEIAALMERGARQVVLTCGAESAFFHDGSTLHHVAAAPAQVLDTFLFLAYIEIFMKHSSLISSFMHLTIGNFGSIFAKVFYSNDQFISEADCFDYVVFEFPFGNH